MRDWNLAEQNHAFIRSRKWEVAVLPFGATEPHNLHMPYGTDNFQLEVIANRACERAYRAGAEVETSLGLAFFPELVRPELADDGAARPTRFEAINRGWVSITRPWHLVSRNTGLGDPSTASAEKGRKLLDVLVERLAGFLVELSAAEVDESFPY